MRASRSGDSRNNSGRFPHYCSKPRDARAHHVSAIAAIIAVGSHTIAQSDIRTSFSKENSEHPAHQKSRSLKIITHPRTPPILSIFFMSQYIHSQPVFLLHSINDTFLKSQSVSIHHIVYFRRLGLIHHWFLTSSFSSIPSTDTAFYLIKNGPVFAS